MVETISRGLLVVLSAPSGAGKRALRQAWLKEQPNALFSPSVTTRPPRPGESAGEDYIFVDQDEFEQLIRCEKLVEWATVFGHSYGTPGAPIEAALAQGRDVLVEKDVQGAIQLRETHNYGVFVFLLPPSYEELRRRLLSRGTEHPEDVEMRLARYQEELRHIRHYDYVIINDCLMDAVDKLKAIVAAEHCRAERFLLDSPMV